MMGNDITFSGVFSALCWFFVGLGATIAVFSPRIKDTTMERAGLSAVALACFASAWQAFRLDFYEAPAALFTSVALAFYVVALVLKHHAPEPPKRPYDKTKPGDLE